MSDLPVPSPCTIPPGAEGKQEFFDRYWITRDFLRTDRRTMERAQLIWPLLSRRSGRVLDVGCGRGLFAAWLSELGLLVDAVDISPQAVELTRRRGIGASLLDLETESPLGVYDLIFCLEVLQQVRDPLAVLGRLRGALAPDGELVISVPNEFHIARRLRILCGAVDFGDLDDSHLKLFTPARGEELLARAGFEISGRAYPSIVPPQWSAPARLGRTAATLWPAGLAIAAVFCARPRHR